MDFLRFKGTRVSLTTTENFVSIINIFCLLFRGFLFLFWGNLEDGLIFGHQKVWNLRKHWEGSASRGTSWIVDSGEVGFCTPLFVKRNTPTNKETESKSLRKAWERERGRARGRKAIEPSESHGRNEFCADARLPVLRKVREPTIFSPFAHTQFALY